MALRPFFTLRKLVFSVSLASFIVFASLIIPLRQKAINRQNIWSYNSGFKSFSSTMSLPSLPLKDGNAIPLVSVFLDLLPVLTPIADRLWNGHSLVQRGSQ
jgi:hypothetical protein